MSTAVIPNGQVFAARALLITAGVRLPDSAVASNGQITYTWNPDLSAGDQATVADIATMMNFGVTMSLAEWQTLKPDAAGLKAYLNLATPTLVQTAAATKAIIRVLATIVRD